MNNSSSSMKYHATDIYLPGILMVEGVNENRWNKAFKVSLVKENHYSLTDGRNAPFLKFMAINRIPCYMIKEGKPASYSAPNLFDESRLDSEFVKLTK